MNHIGSIVNERGFAVGSVQRGEDNDSGENIVQLYAFSSASIISLTIDNVNYELEGMDPSQQTTARIKNLVDMFSKGRLRAVLMKDPKNGHTWSDLFAEA